MSSKSLEKKLPFKINHLPFAFSNAFFAYQRGLYAMIVGVTNALFIENVSRNFDLVDKQLEYLEDFTNPFNYA